MQYKLFGGSMGRGTLKKKIDLHYRRGTTAHDCNECNSFVHNFKVHLIGGATKGIESRCKIMGLENSIRYRINPKNICDAHDNSNLLNRLKNYGK